MSAEPFESMLKGGHHNSLGRTEEVVENIVETPARLQELYDCYFSEDELVRLRTSSALKRIGKAHPDWLVPLLDGLLYEVSEIDQASAQWTLAELMQVLETRLIPAQKERATVVMMRNLETSTDWIVLNHTMQTLSEWAEDDVELKAWMEPQLNRLSGDARKSVAKRAGKLINRLFGS